MAEDSNADLHGVDGGVATRMRRKVLNKTDIFFQRGVGASYMRKAFELLSYTSAMPFLPQSLPHVHERFTQAILAPVFAIRLSVCCTKPNTPDLVCWRGLSHRQSGLSRTQNEIHLDQLPFTCLEQLAQHIGFFRSCKLVVVAFLNDPALVFDEDSGQLTGPK